MTHCLKKVKRNESNKKKEKTNKHGGEVCGFAPAVDFPLR